MKAGLRITLCESFELGPLLVSQEVTALWVYSQTWFWVEVGSTAGTVYNTVLTHDLNTEKPQEKVHCTFGIL